MPEEIPEIGDIILLDLQVDRLYFGNRTIGVINLASIIKGIDHNDTFPAFPVSEVEEGVYESMDPRIGWSHRAAAHYIEDRLLPVILNGRGPSLEGDKTPVEDLEIHDY